MFVRVIFDRYRSNMRGLLDGKLPLRRPFLERLKVSSTSIGSVISTIRKFLVIQRVSGCVVGTPNGRALSRKNIKRLWRVQMWRVS